VKAQLPYKTKTSNVRGSSTKTIKTRRRITDLELILRRGRLRTKDTIFNKQTQKLGYADDIDIIGRSQAAAWNFSTFLALQSEGNKVGTIRNIGQSVERIFVLGIPGYIQQKRESADTKDRSQTANRCFFELRKQLQSKHLSRPTNLIIYKILIRPVLMYSSGDMGADQ
jgi:hypothetical protein